MSGALKPYQKYKESGVEWLGAVPEGWAVVKISHGFDSIGSGTTPPSSEQKWYQDGDVPWVTTGELNEGTLVKTKASVTREAIETFSALQIHQPGALIIAMYGATIGKTAILGTEATSNQACCVLDEPHRFETRFVWRYFQAFREVIVALFALGGGQPNISQSTIASLRLPSPPLPEQQAIADYLDDETQRIDTLIAELREMIRLLKEKRQALISHCVTKGLDPTVPMKDSGVEWLGEVPEGWEVVRIGLVASVSNGTTPSREKADYWEAGTVPWVSSAEVNQGIVTTPTDYVTIRATIDCGMRTIRQGSVLIGLIGQGRTRGMSALLQFDACINQNVAAIEPNEKASAEYVRHYLQHAYEPIRQLGRGGQQDALNNELVRSIIMPLPAIEEQRAIAAHLDRETAKIDRLISETEETITLMQERRSALISSVVTGKLQVPGIPSPSGSTLDTRPEMLR